MNGEKGKVQSFNAATGRYAVQIYSGGPPFTRTRTRINTHQIAQKLVLQPDNGGPPFMLKAANLQKL
jgi:hypothetical protein